MSASWRTRLAQRRIDLGLEGKEYDYVKTYIESYCKESDKRAEKLCDSDMLRTVDQVMNSMADPEFDRFTSGVVADVSKKLGRDDIAKLVLLKQKQKDNPNPTTESETKEHEPIPA